MARSSLSAGLSRGFTLVEVIVVISINTILFLVITQSIVSLYQTNAYSFAQSNEIDSARRGLTTWVRDAREMTSAANGAFPLVVVATSTLAFYGDIDRDNSTEFVEYKLVGTTLYKYTFNPIGYPPTYSTTTPDNVEIISIYVQNHLQNVDMYTYYNGNGSLIASPTAMISDIRYIKMHIIVNIDPLRSPGEFMLQGSATPRNLKDNL